MARRMIPAGDWTAEGVADFDALGPSRYDPEPLRRLAGLTPGEVGPSIGRTPQAFYQWRRVGMSEWTADELAVAHGFHPAQVWPDWFDDALA